MSGERPPAEVENAGLIESCRRAYRQLSLASEPARPEVTVPSTYRSYLRQIQELVQQDLVKLRALLRGNDGLERKYERDTWLEVERGQSFRDAIETEINRIDRQQRRAAAKQSRVPRTELGQLMRAVLDEMPGLIQLTFKPAWGKLCELHKHDFNEFSAEFDADGVYVGNVYVPVRDVRAKWNRFRSQAKSQNS